MSELEPMKYIFDTNCWINARHECYGREVFPDVWANLENYLKKGIIWSPDEVLAELKVGTDDLYKLLKMMQKTHLETDDIQDRVALLTPKYPKLAKKKGSADLYVVAWGKKLGVTVVTQENPKSISKIPAVCNKEKLECYSLHRMMQEEDWKMVNAPTMDID